MYGATRSVWPSLLKSAAARTPDQYVVPGTVEWVKVPVTSADEDASTGRPPWPSKDPLAEVRLPVAVEVARADGTGGERRVIRRSAREAPLPVPQKDVHDPHAGRIVGGSDGNVGHSVLVCVQARDENRALVSRHTRGRQEMETHPKRPRRRPRRQDSGLRARRRRFPARDSRRGRRRSTFRRRRAST